MQNNKYFAKTRHSEEAVYIATLSNGMIGLLHDFLVSELKADTGRVVQGWYKDSIVFG